MQSSMAERRCLGSLIRVGPSVSNRRHQRILLNATTFIDIHNEMITRRALTCLKVQRSRVISIGRHNNGSFKRRVSTASSASSASSTPSAASPLAIITSELDKLAPRYDISADSIEIIRGPVEFYDVLKVPTSYPLPYTDTDWPPRRRSPVRRDASIYRRYMSAKMSMIL
jgi:hypothetical protein